MWIFIRNNHDQQHMGVFMFDLNWSLLWSSQAIYYQNVNAITISIGFAYHWIDFTFSCQARFAFQHLTKCLHMYIRRSISEKMSQWLCVNAEAMKISIVVFFSYFMYWILNLLNWHGPLCHTMTNTKFNLKTRLDSVVPNSLICTGCHRIERVI